MEFNRYNKIEDKYAREIVLLRGSGCKWRKCTFCDYHLDFNNDEKLNYELNKEVLDNVTGEFNNLEVINSGSFVELDEKTVMYITEVIKKKNIKNLSIEVYYKDKEQIIKIKEKFKDIKELNIYIKTGVETFNTNIREDLFKKGIGKDVTALGISKYFTDVCILFGVKGQSKEDLLKDIEIGKKYFRRICINIFTNNSTKCKRDEELVKWFIDTQYNKYINDENVDILIENTDFGVGE